MASEGAIDSDVVCCASALPTGRSHTGLPVVSSLATKASLRPEQATGSPSTDSEEAKSPASTTSPAASSATATATSAPDPPKARLQRCLPSRSKAATNASEAPALRSVADDYLTRIGRYTRCEEVEVKDARALSGALPRDATVVALEVHGEALGSDAFARRLERWGSLGKGDVAFVIGGAEGIPEAVSQNAQARLSLSSLTLPHRLARVVLFEQLYRALTILRGEPYARED